MSNDERLVLLLGVVVALKAGWGWYERLWRARPRSRSAALMRKVLVALPVAVLLTWAKLLQVGAAREVREHGEYLGLFLVLGVVWLTATVRSLAWLGISVVDDVIERENLAAGCAALGGLLGAAITYGCANLGEGPTIWTTLGPAALAFASCTALWAAYQWLSGAAEAIAIERDVGAGLRFAAMALGSSLIVGRSVVGDYVSALATWQDWWTGSWPVVPFVAAAATLQRAWGTR